VGAVRALGFQKTAVGAKRLCAVFFHHILAVAGIVSQFPYRNRQNVSYL